MRINRLPLTYDECRARFHRSAAAAGVTVEARAIGARGPDGQSLTIDVSTFGATRPRRALAVLSGVHGVEGFIGSTLQSELVAHLAGTELPEDMAVLLVHAVNLWGMAWSRRQNESNVDLNRNWRRSVTEPAHNDAYDELHPLACPDTETLPSVDDLLVQALDLVERRGLAWVRDAITTGQYRHPDGLHFGGDRTEESCTILEQVVTERLAGVERLLTLDLHTGHGPGGSVTLLCDQPPGSPQERFLRTLDADAVEATTGNPDATTAAKSGQIANGFAALFPDATCYATSAEFGTVSDEEQLAATYLESWVHRRGDRDDPDHREVMWRYRCCFTPDEPAWEAASLTGGRGLLASALSAVTDWTS
jgi:hypothetical protein